MGSSVSPCPRGDVGLEAPVTQRDQQHAQQKHRMRGEQPMAEAHDVAAQFEIESKS